MPLTNLNSFPHDGNGHPVSVLYGVALDSRVPGLSDTYAPILVDSIGRITVTTVGTCNTRLISGKQSTNATWSNPVALVASSTPCTSVSIQADLRNEGQVWVGGSNVDASTYTGRELWPGDVMGFDIKDLNIIYIDGLSQQRVFYMATA